MLWFAKPEGFMRTIIMAGVVMLMLAVQTRAAEPKAAETAVEAAKRYTSLMQGDQPIKAIETFWEFGEMFQTMFGERLARSSQAEREEMKKLLLGFFRKIYSNPQIVEVMKKATFSDFASKEPKDGKTVVTFNARIGDDKLPNMLVFKQLVGKWRVVDAAASNQPLIAETFGREYKKHADRLTPLEFLKAMTSDAP
jgi:hypothetical protein